MRDEGAHSFPMDGTSPNPSSTFLFPGKGSSLMMSRYSGRGVAVPTRRCPETKHHGRVIHDEPVEAIAADRHLTASSRAGRLVAVLLMAAALALSLASSGVVLAADAIRPANVASGKKGEDAAVRSVESEKRGKSFEADRGSSFLFSYFCGNGEDGLHLASSPDGYHWTARNQGRSFLAPQVGNKLMRDPCLIQGPDGAFQLVWTTGWGDRVIGHASSRDLVRWSAEQAIPVMTHEPAARNAWAPELFYDEDQKQFLIFWSTTIPGRFPETDRTGDNGWNHRVYATTTRDFKTFTATKLFYDGGFNVIDATILKARGDYYLIVKDETKTPVKKDLRIARSAKAEGPYRDVSAPISIHWVEGPSAIRIGDEFLVYFDHYAAPQYYGALRSSDLVHWKDVSSVVQFPRGTRHGTVLRVSKEFLATLP